MKHRSFSSREQRLALIGVVAIAASMIVSGIGMPLFDRAHQFEQEIFRSQRRLVQLSDLVSRTSTIDQMSAAYAALRTDESDESVQGRFLSELEELARLGGLSVSLKPRPVQHEGRVSRLGVELEVEATQEGLLAFLDRLLTGPSLIELERLRISTTASKDFPLRAILVVNRAILRL